MLSRFKEQVEILNSNGEFSINIHAENILIGITRKRWNKQVKEIFENLFKAFCLEVNGDIDGIAEDGNQTWAIVDGKLLPTDPKLQKTYIKKGLTFYSEEQ